MKFTCVLALTLAFLMLALSLASCGEPKQKLTVTVQAYAAAPDKAGEDNLIINMPVEIESASPNVLEAAVECFIVNEVAYTLSADESSIKSIKEFDEVNDTETLISSYWLYYLNGAEPAPGSGRANTMAIKEGDVITYYYTTEDFSK